MMKLLIPRQSPGLLLKPVEESYAYAVNCFSPNSFRILSQAQYEILKAVNGRDDVNTISGKLRLELSDLESFFSTMSQSGIIGFDDEFFTPQKPKAPKSLNFWIHTTDACNLGCSYCYIPTLNTKGAMTETVKKQILQKLVETIKKRKLRHVKFRLAGGEPLTQFPAWKTFIPEARQTLEQIGCEIDFAFITNLTILNQEIIDFSVAHNISFGVSLDGVGSFHDQTRQFRSGAGSFKAVSNNLQKLLTAGIPVSTTTVVTNKNLEGLADLTQYLIDLDIPFRYSVVKGEEVDAEKLERYLFGSFSIIERAIGQGWQFSKRFQFCDLKPNDLGFQTCASGFSGGAIYTDGSLKYCHVQFGDRESPSHSVFNDELDLIDMIEQGMHLEDSKSEDCRKCQFRFICTSGCPVYRKDKKDPLCSLYYKFIPLYYELQAKERLKLLRDYKMIE